MSGSRRTRQQRRVRVELAARRHHGDEVVDLDLPPEPVDEELDDVLAVGIVDGLPLNLRRHLANR